MTHLIPLYPLEFEPGDQMSVDEFLERWERMPSLKFAELIDGVVYMPSPLTHEHARFDGLMHLLLANYAAHVGVCEFLPNATWLMAESAPQPDSALRLLPQYGGKSTVSAKYATGAPEVVVEICRSSRSLDLGPKLALYQRAGVPEYVVVNLENRHVEWRVTEEGSYGLLESQDGILRSRIFPGLWLDPSAFWAGDMQRLAAVLYEGLESPECRDFVERLRST